MPLIIKKRGATYYARGTVAGQRIYESTGCSRRADAHAWATRYEYQIMQRHSLGEEATLTFAEAALDYMNAGGERKHLGKILDHFGPDFLARDMNNAAINAAALDLYPTAAPATITRQLITPIRAVITMAAEDGRTQLRKFRTRGSGAVRTRWLHPEEFETFLDQAGAHLVPILAAMVGTGARVSELLRTDVKNFYAETGQIWLDETKNEYPRMLKMPGRARDLILAQGIPAQGKLFRRPDGKPYTLTPRQTPMKTAFQAARVRAGLGPDVIPHSLRHTWATWFYCATKDYGGLLDLGGWRVSDMAQRYRKIAPDHLPDMLAAQGWDFTRLGRDIPAPDPNLVASQGLHLVK
ncbi:MAG: integrase [Rhodobacteraceae bacterium]|nr:MAG: integrase [Paracoccaceae bacterium]